MSQGSAPHIKEAAKAGGLADWGTQPEGKWTTVPGPTSMVSPLCSV